MAELLKPIGDFLYGLVPNAGWGIIHFVTVLVGLYFAYKVQKNKRFMWAFVLYGIGAILYVTAHFNLGLADIGTAHLLETVLVFVAVILFGIGSMKK